MPTPVGARCLVVSMLLLAASATALVVGTAYPASVAAPSVKAAAAAKTASAAAGSLSSAAPAPAAPGDLPALARTARADFVEVDKAARRLTLLRQGRVLMSYKVALGKNPIGRKTRQGDGRTPEGRYVIDRRNPNSLFHRSLHISYPNAADRAAAARLGVAAGGDIMIHGLRRGFAWLGAAHTAYDWTQGCIAVTNQQIDEIWRAVPDGTPIEIRP